MYFARRWWLAHRQRVAEREAEHAAIAARADQEQAWVLAGALRWNSPAAVQVSRVRHGLHLYVG